MIHLHRPPPIPRTASERIAQRRRVDMAAELRAEIQDGCSSTVEPTNMKENDQWFLDQARVGRIAVSVSGEVTSALTGKKIGSVGSGRYPKISLQDHVTKKIRSMQIHRLVYLLYVGAIPSGMQIDHRDNNKLNSSASNLSLVTPKENAKKAARDGLSLPFPKGNKTHKMRKHYGNRFGSVPVSDDLVTGSTPVTRTNSQPWYVGDREHGETA